MTSLTPGVLAKLLHSMNDADDHRRRPAVLQVIGIIPANIAGDDKDDLWPSHGFYLQLSDSLNSTFVSLSDPDAAATLSDRPQLGQLLLVDRLHPAHPVPRASGVRPVPHLLRPLPCAGHPDPLVARFSPHGSSFLIHPSDAPLIPSSTAQNVPSPRQASRAGSRSASPVPSKCAVPSLVAAATGDENRGAGREPPIVVPSRYRQPSPVSGRKGTAASPRSSGSPGRRLSVGVKASPATGEGSNKKRTSVAAVGSARSGRKSWDGTSPDSWASRELKKSGNSRSKVDQQAKLRTEDTISLQLSNASREQHGVEGVPTSDKKQNTGGKTESFILAEKINREVPQITVQDRKWTDGSISFDTVSENLAKLGKEALQRRNIASKAAADALEEALATESVIRSLRMFSDLCSSSRTGNPLPTVDRFLSIYAGVTEWKAVAESLISSNISSGANDAISIGRRKSVSLWVEAALSTDLEVLSLLSNGTECPSQLKTSQKPAVNHPRPNMLKRHSVGTPSKSHSKLLTTNSWTKGHGMGDTVELMKSLLREMQTWFLKFMEEALDAGFGQFGEYSDDGTLRDKNKIAAVLSHLKRVNEWLDKVGKKPEEESLMEKIKHLKRKIYGFVISHVGSAI